MKALQAIYQNGQIDFLFRFPEATGPVNVLVVFPDEPETLPDQPEPLCWAFRDWPICDNQWNSKFTEDHADP